MNEPQVVHNQAASRFELQVGGGLADCSYRLHSGVMNIVHTGVPPASEGRGVAARLVHAALAHARAQGLKVRPSCSYVAAYMRRHRDTLDLLEP
ncbi:MAG TPA: GNAT family N-acetyltransferase [Rubrivivax sp.]|nr:GNAT family N-acetyltransferase [Rubrivivax sp.]HPO18221.1 GNAT family N-acetyltransferase [Rubrivivax sp.]